ncbi:MAG TPA: 3-deoxy-7-phosphoheptulonate synthase class II [Allosphingosinicella sp.]
MAQDWNAGSWRSFEARQQPSYPDPSSLAAATAELAAYPPLVPAFEARALQGRLADAQAGRAFLLQGGDCAESFAEFSPAKIRSTASLIAAMADQLAAASGLPVIRLARMAGQFAKPRSTDPEVKHGLALPAYRGDIVNGIGFEAAARTPDPERMFRAYGQASATLAHLRELGSGDAAPLYTSHEALLLPFEEALVRQDEAGRAYASSAHLLWIGDRTRFPGSAHVEFARGLANPLAVKCGPSLQPDLLLRLLAKLDPARAPGRITLIARMGAGRIESALPPLLRAARREGHPVLWSCDPMHGNTVKAANGYKTRPFGDILAEVRAFFAVTRAEGRAGGGIHIEMTGQDVTECTGGTEPVLEQDLADRYHTHCDPRLNGAQAMELASLLADILRRERSAAAA